MAWDGTVVVIVEELVAEIERSIRGVIVSSNRKQGLGACWSQLKPLVCRERRCTKLWLASQIGSFWR